MTYIASTWPEVIADLESLASQGTDNPWAAPLLGFAKMVSASKYKRVFHPSLSALTQRLFLTQTKEYEPGRGVLCIQAGSELEFMYQDSGIEEQWWRRHCPPDGSFALLEKAVDQLHLLVRYGQDT